MLVYNIMESLMINQFIKMNIRLLQENLIFQKFCHYFAVGKSPE